MGGEKAWITAKVWGLRVKTLVWTVVQLAGFALIGVGGYRTFAPSLKRAGADLSLLAPATTAVPQFTYWEGLGVLVVGLIVVWLSTSPGRI